MTPEKKHLLELEKAGEYLFHGTESDGDIAVFEPRQAYNYIDGKEHPDGKPAIFASSAAEYAIFMAIVNGRNCSQGCRSGVSVKTGILRNTDITYSATPATLEQIKDDAYGFVYVFQKNDFKARSKGEIEYVAHVPVMPVERVRVSATDLPEEIKLIEK